MRRSFDLHRARHDGRVRVMCSVAGDWEEVRRGWESPVSWISAWSCWVLFVMTMMGKERRRVEGGKHQVIIKVRPTDCAEDSEAATGRTEPPLGPFESFFTHPTVPGSRLLLLPFTSLFGAGTPYDESSGISAVQEAVETCQEKRVRSSCTTVRTGGS